MGGKILGSGSEADRASRRIQSLPHIPDTTYEKEFRDVGDERTMLGEGTFK